MRRATFVLSAAITVALIACGAPVQEGNAGGEVVFQNTVAQEAVTAEGGSSDDRTCSVAELIARLSTWDDTLRRLEADLGEIQDGKRSQRAIDFGQAVSTEVENYKSRCLGGRDGSALTRAAARTPGGVEHLWHQLDHIGDLALVATYEDYGPTGNYNNGYAADARTILDGLRSSLSEVR